MRTSSCIIVIVGSLCFLAYASNRTVQSSGTGIVLVTPTFATVDLGVISISNSAVAAQNGTSSALSNIMRALFNLGLNESDVVLSSISLSPEYEPVPKNASAAPVFFRSRITISVRVSNIKDVGRIIDAAISAGANTLNYVSYGIDKSGSTSAEQLARGLAVEEATQRAYELASLFNASLGRIITVTDSSASLPTPIILGQVDKGLSLPTGQLSITESVVGIWELLIDDGTLRMETLADEEAALLYASGSASSDRFITIS